MARFDRPRSTSAGQAWPSAVALSLLLHAAAALGIAVYVGNLTGPARQPDLTFVDLPVTGIAEVAGNSEDVAAADIEAAMIASRDTDAIVAERATGQAPVTAPLERQLDTVETRPNAEQIATVSPEFSPSSDRRASEPIAPTRPEIEGLPQPESPRTLLPADGAADPLASINRPREAAAAANREIAAIETVEPAAIQPDTAVVAERLISPRTPTSTETRQAEPAAEIAAIAVDAASISRSMTAQSAERTTTAEIAPAARTATQAATAPRALSPLPETLPADVAPSRPTSIAPVDISPSVSPSSPNVATPTARDADRAVIASRSAETVVPSEPDLPATVKASPLALTLNPSDNILTAADPAPTVAAPVAIDPAPVRQARTPSSAATGVTVARRAEPAAPTTRRPEITASGALAAVRPETPKPSLVIGPADRQRRRVSVAAGPPQWTAPTQAGRGATLAGRSPQGLRAQRATSTVPSGRALSNSRPLRQVAPDATPLSSDSDRLRAALDRLASTPCFVAQPLRTADGNLRIDGFGDFELPWSGLQATISEGVGRSIAIERRIVAPSQCAALDFVRSIAGVPSSDIGITLDETTIASGGLLSAVVSGTDNRILHLLIVDDDGVVHSVDDLVRKTPGGRRIFTPIFLTEDPVETSQVIIAMSTDKPLQSVAEMSGQRATDFFRQVAAEAETKGAALEFGLSSFRVTARQN